MRRSRNALELSRKKKRTRSKRRKAVGPDDGS
jgi:hypothetical protein